MRRLVGSVLYFEAIVIVLAIPVAINVVGVTAGPALVAGLGLALAAVVVGARVDRRGGVAAGWVVQGLVVASGIIVPTMAFLGVMFAALYYGALRMVAEPPATPATSSADESASPADQTPDAQTAPADQTTDGPVPPATH